MAAKTGAEQLVPYTDWSAPLITTSYDTPNSNTSGYPRPLVLYPGAGWLEPRAEK